MTDNPQAETVLVEGPQTVSHNANELRRKLATAERIRENADFHLGQEMARRQLAEKETARLRAVVARLRQMTDHWEKHLPELIRTPAVVSAIRAALEAADDRPASTAPLAAGLPLVQGRCPACGTAGLFLGSGGYVTCSSADCPEPDAATTVLEGGANWPAVRAAILREAADICDEAGAVYASKALNDHADGAFALMERFLRKADEAEYVATPCSLPNVCEDGGEPCSTHERLMAHAEGDHELCRPDCGTSPGGVADEARQPETQAEVVHGCPPDGSGVTPCCGRTPFELPRTDRMSTDQALVTCPAAAVSQPGKET
ncbi:hypothetical protein ABT150_23190 [Streptomyces mirabilis]|uniref:hypothetical protein n=1 Tax=Streptomyces mirabilis TaxID=68239 RepID=UPI00331B2079